MLRHTHCQCQQAGSHMGGHVVQAHADCAANLFQDCRFSLHWVFTQRVKEQISRCVEVTQCLRGRQNNLQLAEFERRAGLLGLANDLGEHTAIFIRSCPGRSQNGLVQLSKLIAHDFVKLSFGWLLNTVKPQLGSHDARDRIFGVLRKPARCWCVWIGLGNDTTAQAGKTCMH